MSTAFESLQSKDEETPESKEFILQLHHTSREFLTKNIPRGRTSEEFFRRPISALCNAVPAPPPWKPGVQVLDHPCAPTLRDGWRGRAGRRLSVGLSHILKDKKHHTVTNGNSMISQLLSRWWKYGCSETLCWFYCWTLQGYLCNFFLFLEPVVDNLPKTLQLLERLLFFYSLQLTLDGHTQKHQVTSFDWKFTPMLWFGVFSDIGTCSNFFSNILHLCPLATFIFVCRVNLLVTFSFSHKGDRCSPVWFNTVFYTLLSSRTFSSGLRGIPFSFLK